MERRRRGGIGKQDRELFAAVAGAEIAFADHFPQQITDAFEDDISTFHDLLHRPILEDRDYVPFKWKGHVLDKPIFPLLKQRLFDLWHRTLLVAGVRNPPRLYSLRVGAGARLDGKNEPSLRIYITQ